MRLSIVLISWNSLPYLKACVNSLQFTQEWENTEIIWVDNGSKDGAAQFIIKNYPHIRRIILPENRGVAYARNRGIEKASGKYILFLDDDTIANKEAIYGMTAYMDFHSETGICGCRLTNNRNEVQKSAKEYPGISIKCRNILRSYTRKKEKNTVAISEYEPEYLIGACQLIRKEAIDAAGLLDERIFYGPEDADFCLRVRKCGFRIVYLPQFSIIHHWKRITNRNIFSRLAFKHIRALLYFYKKHHRYF